MAVVAGKKPLTSTLYPAQRRNVVLSPKVERFTRHCRLDPFVIVKPS